MKYQYKKRTYDEAQALAQASFKEIVGAHLTEAELSEMLSSGLLTGGTPGEDWELTVGFSPTDRSHYEIQIYKPSESPPYIEKSFVRMLVPRDRTDEVVHFKWRPPVQQAQPTLQADVPSVRGLS